MRFSDWLHLELNERDWGASDLARQSKMSGHKISRAQITNILNESRKAGPDACIAIAYALGLPRDEVFSARGWLLREQPDPVPPEATPKAAKLIRSLTALDDKTQERLAEALLGLLGVVQLTQKEASEVALCLSEGAPEKPPQVAKPLVPVVSWMAKLNDYPQEAQRDMVGVLEPKIRELIDKVTQMWQFEQYLKQPLSQAEVIELGERIAEFKRLFPDAWPNIKARAFGAKAKYKGAAQEGSIALAA